MEQILYIILGAILALIGSFLTQRYQNYLKEKKEDENLLFQAAINLCNEHTLIHEKEYDSSKRKTLKIELNKIVVQISTKRYRSLALKLLLHSLSSGGNEKKIILLKRELVKTLCPDLVKAYQEIEANVSPPASRG